MTGAASRLAAAALLLLAACSGPEDPMSAAGRPDDAEFREAARNVYEALLIKSCSVRPRFNRSVLLAKEREAMKAFEQGASATAGTQLEVARIDLLYQHLIEQRCERDSDPGFAKLDMERAKRSVDGGLERLEELAPALAFAVPAEAMEAPRAAEFRHLVRKLADTMWAPCTDPAGKDSLLAPARAEIARFKDRLEATRYAVNYALAEADASYLHSITNVECSDEESGETPEQIRRAALAEVRQQIAAIEARMERG